MNPEQLVQLAMPLARRFTPSEDCTSGTVSAALLTAGGHIYTGVCVDTACSLGFCAEHAAVAEMLKARESQVQMIVAVGQDGQILAPCGRCRELLWQVDPRNAGTWVVLGINERATLKDLLPRR